MTGLNGVKTVEAISAQNSRRTACTNIFVGLNGVTTVEAISARSYERCVQPQTYENGMNRHPHSKEVSERWLDLRWPLRVLLQNRLVCLFLDGSGVSLLGPAMGGGPPMAGPDMGLATATAPATCNYTTYDMNPKERSPGCLQLFRGLP